MPKVIKLNDQLARLATMSPAELRAEWRQLYRASPPPLTNDLLMRGIAWRLQEKMQGGMDSRVARELNQLARQLEKQGELNLERAPRLKPGTRLVREWHRQTLHVLVTENGFVFRDRRYASLSHIAREITGAHWSGPRFFGLVKRNGRETPTSEGADGAAI